MIAAQTPDRRSARLLIAEADGSIRHLRRDELATLFQPGDLIVANDAATLPASLSGTHLLTARPIEVRLAAWACAMGDAARFLAIVFGAGDHRTRTEERPAPPALSPGDRLSLGPLAATVERVRGHPRLVELSFAGGNTAVLAGLARHGRPIQYAHVPEPLALWDVWTAIAAAPVAFEPPSAGFALDWRTLAAWRKRGIGFATLTLAAGISSTGDPLLDLELPFDEPFHVPERTAAAIRRTRLNGGRVIAIGTTVVRTLESAALDGSGVRAGARIARGRIGRGTQLRVVDAILTGVHQPGESHFELLGAFADDQALERISTELAGRAYRAHEFGDSMLLERRPQPEGPYSLPAFTAKLPTACSFAREMIV